MAGITAQELNVILSARDREFTKAMDRANRRVQRFAKQSEKDLRGVSSSFNMLGKAAARLGPLIAGAFTIQGFANIAQSAVEIDNLANVAGVTTGRFQELAFAASTMGVEQDKLSDILKDVNDKFGDYVQTGAGPLADFFENIAPKVGLTADNFADLSSEQKLGAYVNALEKANLSQADMTFYMEAIASDATLLQGAFADNGRELDRLATKFRDAGAVMDEDMIQAAKEAKEEFQLASKVISAKLSVALADLLPVITDLATFMATAAKNIGAGYEAMQEFINPTSELETAIDNTVLAMADEITQSRNLSIALGQSTNMSVDAATQKLREAQERYKNVESIIAEQRALKLGSDEYLGIVNKINTFRDTMNSLGINTADGMIAPNMMNRERFEQYEEALRDALIEQREFLKTEKATQDQLNNTRKNIEKLEGALADAKDGYVTFGEELITSVVKSDRLKAKLREVTASTVETHGAVSVLGVTLQEADGQFSALESSVQTFEQGLTDAFMSILDKNNSFKDSMKQMAAEVIKELYRVLVVRQMVNGIMGATGLGLFSGPATGSFGLPFGVASGGAVNAGQPYTVGEHGREIFVPSTAGRILSVPQSKDAVSGGGGDVIVQQTINVTTGVQQTVRNEIKSMMPQIAESAKGAVADARQRGGSYRRALG
jgi:hypothetical protein